MRRGTLATLGVVVLVFVAAIAAYWVLLPARSSSAPSAPTLFSYEQTGAYTYVAHLRNNTLYGTTNLTPGNGTLFTAITSWLNLTFVYRLAGAARFDALSEVRLAVVLQSPQWSKQVEQLSLNTSVTDGPMVSAQLSVDLNVSNVTSLAGLIEKETNYFPSSYQVALDPTITTIVQYANLSEEASLAPTLLLNFTGSEILPSHLSQNQPGSFLGPADPAATSSPSLVPYLVLGGAALGAVVLGLVAYREGRSRRTPDLATLTRPFAEAIVETPSPPPPGPSVPVRTWEDLVKVADTLGCPILRLVPAGAAPKAGTPVQFYVLTASATYTYVHPPRSPAAASKPGGSPTPARPSGARPVVVPSGPSTAPAPTSSTRSTPPRSAAATGITRSVSATAGSARGPQGGSAPPLHWDLNAFVARADQVRQAARTMPPTTASFLAIEEAPDAMLARAIVLARNGRLPEARAILRRLRQELSGEPRPSVRPAPSWDRVDGPSRAPRGPV